VALLRPAGIRPEDGVEGLIAPTPSRWDGNLAMASEIQRLGASSVTSLCCDIFDPAFLIQHF